MIREPVVIGEQRGRLTAIAEVETGPRGHRQILVECSCAERTRRVVQLAKWRSGHTTSCGCLQRERTAVGLAAAGATHRRDYSTSTAEYEAWGNMKQRCSNPNTPGWHLYGGRGITVCDRWLNSFEDFLADMGPRPTPQHSLDRIDSNGPYAPDNCRWATHKQQHRNTRSNRRLTFRGQTLPLAEWAEIMSIRPVTLGGRLDDGWSIEEALLTPVGCSRG